MSFRVTGLPLAPFVPLFGLDEAVLLAAGARRYRVDEEPGFPCRVSLADAPLGSAVLLVNHEHQPAEGPYRSRHAIFVQEGAVEAEPAIGEVPPVLARRLLSVRAFDDEDMMVDAELIEGREVAPLIERMLADGRTRYLHLHYAKRGCYAARVDRA